MSIDPPDLAEVLDWYDVPFNPDRDGNQRTSCPMHEDKTPSLSVNLGKGVLRCFSCDLRGASWQLIMLKEGVDFRGAVAFASSAGFGTGTERGSGRSVSGSSRWGSGDAVLLAGREGARGGDAGFRPRWSSR